MLTSILRVVAIALVTIGGLSSSPLAAQTAERAMLQFLDRHLKKK